MASLADALLGRKDCVTSQVRLGGGGGGGGGRRSSPCLSPSPSVKGVLQLRTLIPDTNRTDSMLSISVSKQQRGKNHWKGLSESLKKIDITFLFTATKSDVSLYIGRSAGKN